MLHKNITIRKAIALTLVFALVLTLFVGAMPLPEGDYVYIAQAEEPTEPVTATYDAVSGEDYDPAIACDDCGEYDCVGECDYPPYTPYLPADTCDYYGTEYCECEYTPEYTPAPVCICELPCGWFDGELLVNEDCPVCAENYADCKGEFEPIGITPLASGPVDGNVWLFSSTTPDGNGTHNGGTWSWVQATQTLTLENITHSANHQIGLQVPAGATINLIGNNIITSTFSGSESIHVLNAAGAATVTINGPGTLTLQAPSNIGQVVAIAVDNLTIANGATVNAFAGDGAMSVGVVMFEANSTLRIESGATLNARGGIAANSFGILTNAANNTIVVENAMLNATGGNATGISAGINAGAAVPMTLTLGADAKGTFSSDSPAGFGLRLHGTVAVDPGIYFQNPDVIIGQYSGFHAFVNAQGTPIRGAVAFSDTPPPAAFPGQGTSTSPFLISTAEQLALLATLVNAGNATYNAAHFRLVNNVDLGGIANWTPIGNVAANPFSGTFDGGNYTVSNLSITGATTPFQGLFGVIVDGTMRDLRINGTVSGANIIGGLAGRLEGSSVENVHANVTVNGTFNLGGLVGQIWPTSTVTTITGSSATGDITSTGPSGGLVGSSQATASIVNSFATGNVTSGTGANVAIGGLVGATGAGNTVTTIQNSFATGSVSGTGGTTVFALGGLVGSANHANISNSAALNPSVDAIVNTSTVTPSVGRVVGTTNAQTSLTNNIAFSGMTGNFTDNPATESGATHRNGESVTANWIHADGTLGGRFASPSWTTANGSLPGLGGTAQPMPAHITVVPTFAITINGGGTGYSASPNPAQAGATVTLNPGNPPAAGRMFSHWTISGATLLPNGTSFVMPGNPVTVTANWAFYWVIEYSANNTAWGSVTATGLDANGHSTAAVGLPSTFTLTAVPEPGYRFVRFDSNDNNLSTSTNNPLTVNNNGDIFFTPPGGTVMFTAVFEPIMHQLTVNGGGTGATASGERQWTEAITLNAGTPPAGQIFTGWTVSPATVQLADPSSATTTFTMPDNAVTVTANWELDRFEISLTPSGNRNFGTEQYGYAALAPHSVTVANTGNRPTGALTVALGGDNPGSFTLSTTNISSIATGGTPATFTVVPDTGLALGIYNATVTVSGGNEISESFNVSFTVSARQITGVVAIDVTGTGVGGAIVDGNVMTANVSGIIPAGAQAGLIFQWYRNNAAIDGATGNTYTVGNTAVDPVGTVITVRVTGTGNFTASQTSAGVEIGRVPLGGSININYTNLNVGGVLTVNRAALTPTDANFTYRWLRGATQIGTGASYTITQADLGQTITVEIAGTVGYTGSLSANMAIPAVAPSAPTNFTATAGNGQVTLSWTAPHNGGSPITRYEVQVNTGAWEDVGLVASHTVTGLDNGTLYTFRVRAVNSATPSIGAYATATATPTAAPPVTNFTVTFDPAGGTRTGGGQLVQTIASGGNATPPTVTRANHTFAGWSGSYTNVTSTRTITAQWTPTVGTGNNNQGGGNGGGGGGGNGGIRGWINGLFGGTPANAPVNVTQATLESAVRAAISAAREAGITIATVNLRNPGEISQTLLNWGANYTTNAGMTLRLQADSMNANNTAVDVRITLNPAQATQGLNLSASTSDTRANWTRNHFTRFFSNDVMAVALGQQGSFGQDVRIAARLAQGLNIDNLHFYTFDRQANTFRAIPTPNHWLDANGYVHFDTSVGGAIIISDGSLVRR